MNHTGIDGETLAVMTRDMHQQRPMKEMKTQPLGSIRYITSTVEIKPREEEQDHKNRNEKWL